MKEDTVSESRQLPLDFRNYKVGSHLPMLVIESPHATYRGGYIATPDGVVGFYAQPRDPPYTSLSVVGGGRCYDISWERAFTDRRLKTLARRFAADIARKVSAQ